VSFRDLLSMAWGALRAHRLRTRLTIAALAVGVGSVLLLTGLGEGARGWIEARFSSIGSNVLIVMPGRTETRGAVPLAVATTRDLTLDDARAIERRLPGVRSTAPLVVGEALASADRLSRPVTVLGTTAGYLEIRRYAPSLGENLPDIEADRGTRVVVLGHAVRNALFGTRNPLGSKIRLGESPFRVVGVLPSEGQSLGVNLDDCVLVPVASAMRLYNRRGLFRLLVQTSAVDDLKAAERRIVRILKERHDDEEDFTIITPGAIAASLTKVVGVVTTALAAIAAIALAVAGIGVMNVMIVSVAERTSEVGLLKALGASRRQILSVFLAEAVLLSVLGGLFGAAAGLAATAGAGLLFPSIPFRVPDDSLALAVGVSAAVGILFGILPARRAARLDPLEALRKKG
jgi:putative ABC transport system permease protein